MADFPNLQPAMTIRVTIDPPLAIGSVSRGTPLNVAPMVGGSAKSESGFEPKLDAEFVGQGMDFIHNDPDGKVMRLDAHQVLRTHDGALLKLSYTGIIHLTPELGKILGGSPDAKTTEFRDAFTHLTFETGVESLKELETSVFVSSGRFVIEQGQKPFVEYKVSKVVKG